MRRLILLLSLLSLATISLAGPAVTITPLNADPAKWYEGAEGFETSMPPSGWTRTVTNAAAAWMLFGADPYEGNSCATSQMEIMGEPIDEWLSFSYSYTSNQFLHFAVKGQTAVNATLNVYVGEDLVFDFARDWTLPWDQWGLVEIDLSTTNGAGFPNTDFSWRYVGTFAPSIYLDAVGITEEAVSADVAAWGTVKSLFR